MEIEKVFISVVGGIAFLVFALFQFQKKKVFFYRKGGILEKKESPFWFYSLVLLNAGIGIFFLIDLFNRMKEVGFEIIF